MMVALAFNELINLFINRKDILPSKNLVNRQKFIFFYLKQLSSRIVFLLLLIYYILFTFNPLMPSSNKKEGIEKT